MKRASFHLSNVIFLLFLLGSSAILAAQTFSKYPDIPRIDVHTHASQEAEVIRRYLELREIMLETHHVDLAMWINLGDKGAPVLDIQKVDEASEKRMVCTIADYRAHDGLQHDPAQLKNFMEQGFVGYKIWSGPWYRGLEKPEDGYPYVDDPAHEPTFNTMEAIGMVGASVHIADPNGPWDNRTDWLADPVEFWKEIVAWTNVLERHPDLQVVMAHSNWLICQDAQIDYLRYLMATYPNYNIDLAATFQYYHLVSSDNIRSFMIEWADRILYGTDIGRWKEEAQDRERMGQYFRTFEILETDNLVKGGFFGGPDVKGLNLPKEVLEKIYYKNALRIYPGLRQKFLSLGYDIP